MTCIVFVGPPVECDLGLGTFSSEKRSGGPARGNAHFAHRDHSFRAS